MSLRALARRLGVHTAYVDGLGRHVEVGEETLARVCAALGATPGRPGEAGDALRSSREEETPRLVPPVLVAWNGWLDPVRVAGGQPAEARLDLEEGGSGLFTTMDGALHIRGHLPWGYHRLTVEAGTQVDTAAVISAPERAWQPRGAGRGWGVGVHMAALRAGDGGPMGGPADLVRLGDWIAGRGGSVVTVLPLLPTFNQPPAEPSPYSPVSRLFWSELLVESAPFSPHPPPRPGAGPHPGGRGGAGGPGPPLPAGGGGGGRRIGGLCALPWRPGAPRTRLADLARPGAPWPPRSRRRG